MSCTIVAVALVVCGIDEAGYGPLLGPLAVGMSAFRVADWEPGEPPPDLWALLGAAVCQKPVDAARYGLIAVADSKRLKLPNSLKTRHPLVHLERGVLAFLRHVDPEPLAPATDAELLLALGAGLEDRPWFGGCDQPLPVGSAPEQIAIAANLLAGALAQSGVRVLEPACEVVGVEAFNRTVARTGTKAETTLGAIGRHLRRSWVRWGGGPDHLRVVCDRLGGRISYAQALRRELPCARVEPLEESARVSRYELSGDGHRVVVMFTPEAEARHLPVAMASMIAKLVRELAMARFNRHFCGLLPELKPTAGYRQDAARWLRDASGVLTKRDRAAMIRNA